MNLGFDLNDWNNTEAREAGEREVLTLGGHIVEIKDASLYTSEYSGNTSLKIEIDTAKDDAQPGYFQKLFDENTNKDKKWSTSATRYLSLKKENLAYTKGFITSLEKSNNNFKFDTSKDWSQLKGLKCAGVFGWEEFEASDGSTKVATKITQFRSLDKLNDIRIPRVKTLNNGMVDYIEYKEMKKNNTTSNPFESFNDIDEITDNILD